MREEALSFSDAGCRQASARVVINGSVIAGVVRAEVTSSNYYGADCFKAELAVGAAPLSVPAFWGETLGIEADVQFSLDGINYTSLIIGQVDNVRLDPLVGLVLIAGRDFTATFIEAAVEDSFLNRTASEVVEMLAGDADFACVATPTTTIIGRYYEDAYGISGLDQFSQFTTQWDLLVYLARQEGFDLFFSGRTLNFQPSGLNAYTAVVSPGDCTTLRLNRSLVLSRDIELTIRSWNSRQQSAYTQLFIGAGAGDGTGQPIRYKITHPNLTPDQITSLGFRRMAELASYERCVELEMPGELALTPRDLLSVAGTGTQFDQTYRIQSIQRCIDSRRGFKEVIRAASATPRSVTVTGAIPG
jgi:hypothetical protein